MSLCLEYLALGVADLSSSASETVSQMNITDGNRMVLSSSYWCLAGNGWDWGNGMIITSDYGSFPHSLLSTSKSLWSDFHTIEFQVYI